MTTYKVKNYALAILISAILFFNGCNGVKYSPADEAKYFKPSIAVVSFENKAPVQTGWQLGTGLADQLTDRLMATHRYVVVERAQLARVLKELKHTDDPDFRKLGQPQRGQLKHVKYLVKGTITDFSHYEKVEGIWKPILNLFGVTGRAVVAATIYVIDVESGQVMGSSSVEAIVKAKKGGAKVNYQGMAFGGYHFYHTPLGRATNEMLDKAVWEIAQAIAETPYQPKIASIINNRVVINGGKDRRIEVGDEYVVHPSSERITDPDTGDVIGHITGKAMGRVRVMQVTEKYSIAEVMRPSGSEQFAPGQTLFKVQPENLGRSAAITSY